MKLSRIFVLLTMLIGTDALAQWRPRPRPPRPMPQPMRLVCHGTDLYEYGRFIHRFFYMNHCLIALRDIRFRGKFCDQGSMYNRHGRYLGYYGNRCRQWL
jgi:hypothetical protein